ncbi:uncharacterized protein LOC131180645 [Hevea brasiliensis]|uniref:uncharacterized protein LOC131180645 n=1 Tax=Hevea brasiliensis TaxID=3981 RepID=UPI0025E358A7|nr:uncharacterized protein LOC131180645 [Hevea brasiliensis]
MDAPRSWMYARKLEDGLLNPEFVKGLEAFIKFACSKPKFMDGSKIRCPCKKCINRKYLPVDDVQLHLLRWGFRPNYHEWTAHGESMISSKPTIELTVPIAEVSHGDNNPYCNMVYDAVDAQFQHMASDDPSPNIEFENMKESPNSEAQKFYDMLNAAEEELWPGCDRHSQLSAVARMLNIKSEYHLSEKCYNAVVNFIREVLPDDNKFVDSFYKTKKLIRGLGLPVEKIDCCKLGCMIYWGEDSSLTECKFCGQARYKSRSGLKKAKVACKRMYYFPLTPRL